MAKERLIKRYTNRKLYDTLQSRYVTLEDIAKLVREGEEVRVIDNDSTEDLTAVTFAQIILDEEKRKTHLISTPFLRNVIRSGEATMQDLSDAASRGIEALGEFAEKAGDRVRGVVEDGGEIVDDVLRAPQKRIEALRDVAKKSVDSIRRSPALQREVERIEKSLHAIEEMVGKLRDADDDERIVASANGTSSGISAERDSEAVETAATEAGTGASTVPPAPARSTGTTDS